MTAHAYLGPEGTFTEAALRAAVSDGSPRLAMPTVAQALEAVRSGRAADATVPWENSVAGLIPATLRGLAVGPPLRIVREVALQVELVLAGQPGTQDVRRVLSHPHALAQAARWLTVAGPPCELIEVSSTARAAELVSRGRHDSGDAAVCSAEAARRYRLRVIARQPADGIAPVTRFVTLARAPRVAAAPSRTALLVYLPGFCGSEDAAIALKHAGLSDYRIDPDPLQLADQRCARVLMPGVPPPSALTAVVARLSTRGIATRFLGSFPSVEIAHRDPAIHTRRNADEA